MRNSAYETEQVNQQPLRHISILFLELDTFYTFCCSIQLSYARHIGTGQWDSNPQHTGPLQVLNFVAVSVEAK